MTLDLGQERPVSLRLRTPALVVIALAAGVLPTRGYRDVSTQSAVNVIEDLLAVVPLERLEPRISIAPRNPGVRSRALGESWSGVLSEPGLAVKIARLEAQAATPEEMHAAGVASLLLGRTDRAIAMLESAARMAPSSSDTRLDLAAGYYVRGVATKSLRDFNRALQTLSGAGPSAAATFNRALIFDRLSDREASSAEWARYLTLDDGSRWAETARSRLRESRRSDSAKDWASAQPRLIDAAHRNDWSSLNAIVSRFPFETRRLAEREILPAWAEAVAAGNQRPARELGIVVAIARSIAAVNGDAFLVDLTDELRIGAHQSQIASGILAYREGREGVEAMRYDLAASRFGDAVRIFGSVNSAAAASAMLWEAVAQYYRSDYPSAAALVATAERQFAGRRYLAFEAHLAAVRGLVETVQGNPSGGLKAFQRSLAGYERLRELGPMATQHTNLADTLQYLGEYERASVHRYMALELSDRIADPLRLHPILSEAADAALADGMPKAALAYQVRLVRLAEESGSVFRIADARITRSTIHRIDGNRGAALQDLAAARRHAEGIEDRSARERLLADFRAAEAFAYREADDARAIESLSASIDFYRRVGFRLRLAQLLLERGRARLRRGETAEAESDFRSGISELETQRQNVPEADLRIAYFDRAELLFVELALALMRRGLEREAFDVLERSRARELLDATTGGTVTPLSSLDLQARIDASTTLVTTTLTPRGVIVAVLSPEIFRVRLRAADPETIRLAVDGVVAGVESPRGLPAADLAALAAVLAPVLDAIRPGARLVIVPDHILARVPYAALLDRQGRRLIEKHPLMISPSATLYVESAQRDRQRRGAEHSALIVASSDAPRGFDDLPPLDRVRAEVKRISAAYRTSRVVDRITDSLLAEAGRVGVVHFAGHGIVNEQDPRSSMLLIGAEGRLLASEIEATRLPRTRLVILGACSTAMGRSYRGEGTFSLARAFLSASVPTVVGTLTPVTDDVAASLLSRFHEAYAQGMDAATAMQEAQLAMLRVKAENSVRSDGWAAFQVIGGADGRTREEKRP